MKIINNNWQRQIFLEDNLIHTIILENKKYYRENILELIRQHKGYEGNFILSINNKEVSFDKNSYFISDLFNIDINNKKINLICDRYFVNNYQNAKIKEFYISFE